MKLDCYLAPSEVTETILGGKVVVIIDVLRACTTMAYALFNGAERIIPAATVETAIKLMSLLDRESTLLCGERGGKKVKGFDLGNSPLEYTREVIENKTIVFASTNGTRMMAQGLKAQEQLLCSFVNIGKVVERLKPCSAELVIVNSGMNGCFSLEDAVCAGMAVSKLKEMFPGAWEFNDGAQAAVALFDRFGDDIHRMLLDSSNGSYLVSLGFGSDIEASSRIDSIPVLPILREGRITLFSGCES